MASMDHGEVIESGEENEQTKALAESFSKIIVDIGEDPSRQVSTLFFCCCCLFFFFSLSPFLSFSPFVCRGW